MFASAATTVGDRVQRSEALIDAGCDRIAIDTAHGHNTDVARAVERVKSVSNSVQVVAGNVATADAAKALADSGAVAIKAGIGPAPSDDPNRCRSRSSSADRCDGRGAGRERSSDHCRRGHSHQRRHCQGARCRSIVGHGRIASRRHRRRPRANFPLPGCASYKSYRGMGSVGAMARGSADRYFQQDIQDHLKLVPEGIEGQVPYKGPVRDIIHQLVGGVKAAMDIPAPRPSPSFASAQGSCA